MRYTFTTTDPIEAAMLLRSSELHVALFVYDQWLHGQIKHQDRNELQDARDKLYDLLPEGTFE